MRGQKATPQQQLAFARRFGDIEINYHSAKYGLPEHPEIYKLSNITKDGKTGFVALGPANRVAVINGATHEVQKYLLVGQRVWHLAFTPDEKYLLTTNGVSNDVSVIDVASLKVIKTIQVGELPWGVAISQQ